MASARPVPRPTASPRRTDPRSRLLAAAALALALVTAVVGVIVTVRHFPRGLIVLCLIAAAGLSAWHGLLRRGLGRVTLLGLAAAMAIVAIILLVGRDPLATVLIVIAAAGALQCVRLALVPRVALPAATPPSHPVLIFNPRSGGGKAIRFGLADEAKKRGIEAVEMRPDESLQTTVEHLLALGADGLAMAGGDGSQAQVAAIAAREGIPYACVPAGTRNHFALDLGVDRDDVVGALDAFVNGGERVVDLAEVNGQVFVNNVSIGIYGDAVQRAGYRDAKLKTIVDVIPDVAGAEAPAAEINWRDSDGFAHDGGIGLLVSNNVYRLGRLVGSGTRPRLDAGRLGVTVMESRHWLHRGLVRRWTPESIEVDGADAVPAGVDGEAILLTPPIRFTMRPGVLRVRIAPQHPGCSPSAGLPASVWAGVLMLVRMVMGATR
jgi:diacylglycerol kinase family enzyme